MVNIKKIVISAMLIFFTLSVASYAQPGTLPAKNKPETFKINIKIPGYYYTGKPKVRIGADFKESKWILKKKNGDIALQLIIRVEVDQYGSFFIIIAVDNASGVNKYRGIYHHYKRNSDNIWIHKKIKASDGAKHGKILLIESFLNPGDIPLYTKELITIVCSKNPGTENIVALFMKNVDPAAAKNWLLRAVKFTETAILENKNNN